MLLLLLALQEQLSTSTSLTTKDWVLMACALSGQTIVLGTVMWRLAYRLGSLDTSIQQVINDSLVTHDKRLIRLESAYFVPRVK